jgi:SAM-dependent methyltransferase
MIRCAACGEANDSRALFCRRCTAPVGVVPLQELGEAEHRQYLSALFEVLTEVTRRSDDTQREADEELWRAYLSAFWLRPETALILYAEALAIRSMTGGLNGPWLDLGCGDGIHAGIYAGWRFHELFDAFQSLDLSVSDIYNRYDPAEFSASVVSEGRHVEQGVDLKPTAVARARALGVFRQVTQADATRLPLAAQSVGVIFSNMLRDLGEPLPTALAECRRILREDGALLISAMTPLYASSLYFAPAARQAEMRNDHEAARQLLRLDRGRSVFCQRQLSVEQWESLLAQAGLRITGVTPIAGPDALRFWDVGLRPFSLALLRERDAWRKAGVLGPIKRSVTEAIHRVLAPLVRTVASGDACMHLIVAKRV